MGPHSIKAPTLAVSSEKFQRSRAREELRIVGGAWRSRRLRIASRPDLRPTPDRVRETLFNWLGQTLTGELCLDLFAGSGALGFEAASRGAGRVVMIESDSAAVEMLERAKAELGAEQVEIRRADAIDFLARGDACFDIVFVDPPFREGLWERTLERLPGRLVDGARVYLESPRALEPGAGWTELRRKRAGQVSYQLWQWSKQQ